MVTVSEDNFCEVAFHDVCYDCVHMHVGVYMDTVVCVCIYVHYTMHVHMHMCARPHHVCLSWLCSFPLPTILSGKMCVHLTVFVVLWKFDIYLTFSPLYLRWINSSLRGSESLFLPKQSLLCMLHV